MQRKEYQKTEQASRTVFIITIIKLLYVNVAIYRPKANLNFKELVDFSFRDSGMRPVRLFHDKLLQKCGNMWDMESFPVWKCSYTSP